MDRFIRRENIKRYRNLLREAKDEAARRLIQKLLIEEEQKEAAARTPSPSTARSLALADEVIE
jgi:3-hydroxyacyl-CoA dehydrogenase